MKNITLDRTTVLQLDVDGADSALDAAADCDVLRNDAALDRAPSPIRRSEACNSPLIRPKTCGGPLHSTSVFRRYDGAVPSYPSGRFSDHKKSMNGRTRQPRQ